MKNWGTRILFLYLGFVALIATLVTMSMKQNTDLVAKDYYARELAYQNKLDKMNRSRALLQPVKWQLENGKLVLQFPDEIPTPVNGTIVLYCPSDAGKDFQQVFSSATHNVSINIAAVTKAQYELQIDWQAGTQTYYDEGNLIVP